MSRPGKQGPCGWVGVGMLLCWLTVLLPAISSAQRGRQVFSESFDLLVPPALPSGWTSSRGKSPPLDDWASSSSSPLTPPNALLLVNATIAQSLVSPPIPLGGEGAGEIRFALRRSSSFVARVSIDASTNGGITFPVPIAQGLFPERDSRYETFVLPLPAELNGVKEFQIRWSTTAEATGSTGTLRMDDLSATTIPLYDCAACTVSYEPDHPVEGDHMTVVCTVTNAGAFSPTWCEAYLRWVRGGDLSSGSDGGVIAIPTPIRAGETVSARAEIEAPSPGEYQILAILRSDRDALSANDTARRSIRVGAQKGRVTITEIMYAPAAGGAEWIEIYNAGTTPLDLSGWSVGDEGDPAGRPIPPGGSPIGVGTYAVCVADTLTFRSLYPALRSGACQSAAVPSLNNTGDLIIFNDLSGRVIDSVRYSPQWHHPVFSSATGRSLERVSIRSPSGDPRNWGSSVDPAGCTPGMANSIAYSPPPPSVSLAASPNPFSPDGDGHDDRTAISYRNPAGGGTLTLRVYDARGRFVRLAANNEPSAAEGVVFWDGLDEGRKRVRMGIYVLLLEIVGKEDGSIWRAKGSVIVAGRL